MNNYIEVFDIELSARKFKIYFDNATIEYTEDEDGIYNVCLTEANMRRKNGTWHKASGELIDMLNEQNADDIEKALKEELKEHASYLREMSAMKRNYQRSVLARIK